MLKTSKSAFIFLLSFVLNLAWESVHSSLYAFYQHGPITFLILVRAAIVDAVMISFFYTLYLYVPLFKNRLWLVLLLAGAVAIAIELFALQTGRWEYRSIMPLIPVLRIGLSPVVQLPLLSWLAFIIIGKVNHE